MQEVVNSCAGLRACRDSKSLHLMRALQPSLMPWCHGMMCLWRVCEGHTWRRRRGSHQNMPASVLRWMGKEPGMHRLPCVATMRATPCTTDHSLCTRSSPMHAAAGCHHKEAAGPPVICLGLWLPTKALCINNPWK